MIKNQKSKESISILLLLMLLFHLIPASASISAPKDVSAEGADKKVVLRWSAIMEATGYSIYMGTQSGQYNKIATVTDTMYTAKGLTNGTTYYFVVTALDSSGESPYSVEVSASCAASTSGGTATDGPSITGYTATTTHGGEIKINGSDWTDQQTVILNVTFSEDVMIAPSAILSEIEIKLNGSEYQETQGQKYYFYNITNIVQNSADSVQFNIDLPFAPYAGYLTLKQKHDTSGALMPITGIVNSFGTTANWNDIAFYIPNGVGLETISQTPADKDAGTAPSVTKRVTIREDVTRGMVHILFLKNGKPVGSLDSYGANLTTHYHDYLRLTAAQFASMLPGWFNTAFNKSASSYPITYNNDDTITITITANEYQTGDVLDLRIFAYPQDRDTQADRSLLNTKITEAKALSDPALSGAIAIASAVANSIYYLQSEVDAATAALESAYLTKATFEENGGSEVADLTPSKGYVIQSAPISTKSGYTLEGWYLDPAFSTPAVFPYTLSSSVTFYAKWNIVSTGDGTGTVTASGASGDSAPAPTPTPEPKTITAAVNITAKPDANGKIRAVFLKSEVEEAVKQAMSNETTTIGALHLLFSVNSPSEASSVHVVLEKSLLPYLISSKTKLLTLSLPNGAVVLNASALTALTASSEDVTISLSVADVLALSTEMKKLVGSSAVYQLSFLSGQAEINSIPPGTMELRLPYSLKQGQDAEKCVADTISKEGILKIAKNSRYDAEYKAILLYPDGTEYLYTTRYADAGFTDLSGWSAPYVNYLAARGIVSGQPNGRFEPEANITRAEFLTILSKLDDAEPDNGVPSEFSDVTSGDWYNGVVQWGYQNKLISGFDGQFFPNAQITREDIAVILERYAGAKGWKAASTADNTAFTDASSISGYALSAVTAMKARGLLSGNPDHSFAPQKNATRAEAAKIFALLAQSTEPSIS